MRHTHWKWGLLLAGSASLTALAALPEQQSYASGGGSGGMSCVTECAAKLETKKILPEDNSCLTTCQAERAQERPRAEEYSSYSLYLQALFAYQRVHQKSEFPEPTSVSSSGGAQQSSKLPESLDDAIARASQGLTPHYVDSSANPRSTFKTFGLNQVPGQDLSLSGVDGVLGIFGAHNITKVTGPRAAGTPDESSTPFNLSSIADINYDNIFFDSAINKSSLSEQITILHTTVNLEDGWTYVNGYSSVNPDGSMSLTLSSNVKTSAYIVDRDGLPGVYPGAGAILIDPLRIQLEGLHANISAQNKPYPDVSTLTTTIFTNNGIRADLSGTKISVTEATKGAPDFTNMRKDMLGPPTTILEFGPNSELVIAPGLHIRSVLNRADGRNRPLTTATGRIQSISLNDISMIDNPNDGRIHIGKFSITELLIRAANVYVIGSAIEVDQDIQADQIAAHDIGAGPRKGQSTVVGDIYIDNVRMRSKVRFESH